MRRASWTDVCGTMGSKLVIKNTGYFILVRNFLPVEIMRLIWWGVLGFLLVAVLTIFHRSPVSCVRIQDSAACCLFSLFEEAAWGAGGMVSGCGLGSGRGTYKAGGSPAYCDEYLKYPKETQKAFRRDPWLICDLYKSCNSFLKWTEISKLL